MQENRDATPEVQQRICRGGDGKWEFPLRSRYEYGNNHPIGRLSDSRPAEGGGRVPGRVVGAAPPPPAVEILPAGQAAGRVNWVDGPAIADDAPQGDRDGSAAAIDPHIHNYPDDGGAASS